MQTIREATLHQEALILVTFKTPENIMSDSRKLLHQKPSLFHYMKEEKGIVGIQYLFCCLLFSFAMILLHEAIHMHSHITQTLQHNIGKPHKKQHTLMN